MFLVNLIGLVITLRLSTATDITNFKSPANDITLVDSNSRCSTDNSDMELHWKLQETGSCFVELQSWGGDDSSQVGYAHINKDLQVNYSVTDNKAYTDLQGFNTQQIRSTNCMAFDSRHFDTAASSTASGELVDYVHTLENGTILYGVTCNDVTSSLTAGARSALLAIGVNLSELVYRGKLTFVAVIGRPQSTVFHVARNGSDNLMTTAIITTTVKDLTGYCYIELRSWGYDDSTRLGYARVNGFLVDNYERPDHNEQVRGFNIYVLRLSDCTTTESNHFDTSNDLAHGSNDMAQYLGSLANGSVVYGATCDDAKNTLLSDARSELKKIGVDVTSLVLRGKLTFVAVIGRPQSAVFRIAGLGGDNLFMNALITQTPTHSADQTTVITVTDRTDRTTSRVNNSVVTTSYSTSTTNAYWFPIAVSSLVLNAVAIIVTTLVIIYAKKQIERSYTSIAVSQASSTAVLSSSTCDIHGAEGYTTPSSYYHLPLPEIPNQMTTSPAYGVNKLAVDELPDYVDIE